MPTLHIEHAISSFDTWKNAFDRFAESRRAGGVRSQRISRPVDDDHYVVIDLDFDTAAQATSFLGFLRDRVWSTPDAAPALVGDPQARVLAPVEE